MPVEWVDEDVGMVAQALRVGPLALGTRMVVLRLPGNGLLLHSPVAMDAELVDEIRGSGEVQAIVAPNRMHDLYLKEAARSFPGAELYATRALIPRHAGLALRPLGENAAEPWKETVEQVLVEGMPRLDEWVFFHRPSRTLLLTDVAFHIKASPSWATRVIMRLNGRYGSFGPTRIMRSMIRDRDAFRRSLARVLAWDVERITLAHGEIIARDGSRVLREAFAPLL